MLRRMPLPDAPAFHPWGNSHQIVLAVVALVMAVMLVLARTNLKTAAERVFGTLLLTIYPAGLVIHALCGSLHAQTVLPLQYCDIAAIAGGLSLWTQRQFWCEVVYFFGIAGTLQGLLTPSLSYEFPDPRFFLFFALHGGVPVASFYVVGAMRQRPQAGAVRRMMIFSLAWYAVTALTNLVLGTNYAFQCQKPTQASLFDHLGPIPWHNASAILIGLLIYSLLHLPFIRRSKV